MGDDRTRDEPGGEEVEAPDLATVLAGTVRSVAMQLPRDRVLPVVYVVDPFPADRSR